MVNHNTRSQHHYSRGSFQDGMNGEKEQNKGAVILNPAFLGATSSSADLLDPLDFSRTVKTWQYLCGLSATLAAAAAGCVLGYTSPVIPQLEEPGSEIQLDDHSIAWIGSLTPLGAMFGGLGGGTLCSKLGKRKTIILNMIPLIGSLVLLIAAKNIAMLYAGRFIAGLCVGITFVSAPAYVAEIADPTIRGTLGSCFQLMVTVGVFSMDFVGIWAHWRVIGVVAAIFPALTIVALAFLATETPLDCLAVKGDTGEALESLRKLRGSDHDCERELDEIRTELSAAESHTFTKETAKSPMFYKPMIVVFGLMIAQQMCGINAAIFYTVDIFHIAGTSLEDATASNIVKATLIISTVVSVALADRLGRKPLLLASGVLTAAAFFAMGAYFYIKDAEKDEAAAEKLGALPVASLILFVFAFSIGFGPLPWVMMNELFPQEVRSSAASSAAVGFNWLLAFIVTLTFVDLEHALGEYGAFWLFACFSGLSVPFIIFLVPETKGKSIEDIQKHFQR